MGQYLLKKVNYATRKHTEMTDLTGNKIIVIPTFPYNPSSKSSPKTAKNWARHIQTTPPAVDIETENEPFKIKILNIEHRGNGGRAYKVIDQNNRLFDLREDQVLEAIATCGIDPGGTISGDFQWGVRGSAVTLTLVNGKLWTSMTAEYRKKEREKKNHIKGSELEVGMLYQGHDKRWYGAEVSLYLGKVKVDGKTKHAVFNFYTKKRRDVQQMNYLWHWNGSYRDKQGNSITWSGPPRPIKDMSDQELFDEIQTSALQPDVNKYWSRYSTVVLYSSAPTTFVRKLEKIDISKLTDRMGDLKFRNGNGLDFAEEWYEKTNLTDAKPGWSSLATRAKFDQDMKNWRDRAMTAFNAALDWDM